MRPYYRDEFREEGRPQFQFGLGGNLWPPAMKYTIIVTVICYLFQLLFQRGGTTSAVIEALVLEPSLLWRGYVWQLVTYTLLHGSPLHLLLNMFILWMFGREVEQALGAGRFIALYVLSGIAAGLCTSIFDSARVIGASGAVLGILMSFGMLFPRRIVLFMFIIPMPAKLMVFIFAIVEILNCSSGTKSQIACFAHLGGLAFGYLFVKTRRYWERYLADLTSRMSSPRPEVDDGDVSVDDEVEMDRLLAKIKSEGLHSLSWREKRFLDRISQRLRDR
jgi:membrane associated rhomboid family serine protease